MKQQINHQFVNKLVALTQLLLIDQAKVLSSIETKDKASIEPGIEQSNAAAIVFSDQDLSVDTHQDILRQKYFPLERKGFVPFADDTQEDFSDRQFFFEQLRSEVRNITDNYQHFSVVLPAATAETSTQAADVQPTYTFTGDQLITIYKIVFKLCYGFEQRRIDELTSGKSTLPQGGVANENKKEQPSLEDFGEKILFQGQSGNFDVILTRQELEDMSQSSQRVEEISKEKGLPRDEKGKPVFTLFMPADELTNTMIAEIRKKPLSTHYKPFPLEEISKTAEQKVVLNHKETLQALQRRRALKFQFDLIKASNGTIKIIQDVQIDLNGNAFLIAKDRAGNEFMVKTDLKVPSNQTPKYTCTVSAPSANGIDTDFILVLAADELEKLRTASIVDLFNDEEARVIRGQPSSGQVKVARFQPKLKSIEPTVTSMTHTLPALTTVQPHQMANVPDLPLILDPLHDPLHDRSEVAFKPVHQHVKAADALSGRKKLVKIHVGKGLYLKRKVSILDKGAYPKQPPFKAPAAIDAKQKKKAMQAPQLITPAKGRTTQNTVKTTQNKIVNPATVAAVAAGGGLLVGSSVLTAFTVLFS